MTAEQQKAVDEERERILLTRLTQLRLEVADVEKELKQIGDKQQTAWRGY